MIKVKFVYEFEFDDGDLDPKHIITTELAKQCAFLELKSDIKNKQITADDFVIENRKED